MIKIDVQKSRDILENEIKRPPRTSWLINQDFRSLQLPDNIIVQNRQREMHSDYVLELNKCSLFGFKTVVRDNIYCSDELLHSDFDFKKLSRTVFSPISNQIQYSESESLLNIDDKKHKKEINLGNVVGVFSDEPANYGSFMYRVVPKIKKCIDLGYGNATFMFLERPYRHEIIKHLFGIKIKTIHHNPQYKYTFKKLYLPSSRAKNCLYSPDCMAIFTDAARRIAGKGVGKKIYVSRRKMAEVKPNFRVLLNELELVQKLKALGYVEFCPEEYDIETQIATFRDAEEIIICGGSALFNLPYACNARFIIDLESMNHWVFAHSNILYSVGAPFSIIYGKQDESGFKLHKNWWIDIDEVLTRVNQLREYVS